MKDFHESAHFLIAAEDAQHQQEIGGIGEIFFGVGEAGLNDASLAGGENFPQQLSVPLLLFLAFVQPSFTEIDL